MISYNPKDWFSFIFRFHKADTFRALFPLMVAISTYSGLVAYMELEFWQLSKNDSISKITIMHNMLGFVISLLLVFRTNTAYDRWWEGRKQWGALANNVRNLALKLSALLDDPDDRQFFKSWLPAYAYALAGHLQREQTRVVLFEGTKLDHTKHVPNQVAGLIIRKVSHLHKSDKINGYELITINAELQSFTDICGACERIKNTPIPYSYSAFLKKFIFFYVMSLPFGYVFDLSYLVIPVVVFIFYVLASLELIAEEIEEPFGLDTNDLPTYRMADHMKEQVEDIFEEKTTT
ncbi:MAG: hypothetical protein K9I85_13925 [Saprospiraceae bacterium]|nr:hypothetical protein [Saprospiraceae bacterium]